MKDIFNKIEEAGISIDKYKENGKLCGYELNTYTDKGLNQILFIDFRDTNKNPKSKKDFLELFKDRVNSIDIDEEIEINRQNIDYKNTFTIRESLLDLEEWYNDLVSLVDSL